MKADFSTLQVQLEDKNSSSCFRAFIQGLREVWAAAAFGRAQSRPRRPATAGTRDCAARAMCAYAASADTKTLLLG